jgi:hypothetical protein
MRLIFAVVSLMAVAAFALHGEQQRSHGVESREVQKFRSGQEYRYQLDTQISSGFATVSDQHAMTRLQAQVFLQFQSERSVAMRMEDIIMGTLNRDVQEPEKVQPMEMFKKVQAEDKHLELLSMPVQFDYVEGIIENIRFHQDDKSWSKNIKRSVLNMLQANLKKRTGLVNLEAIEKEYQDQENMPASENKMFTLPEMTLEGECQITYSINKMSPHNKYNRYSEDNEEDVRMFNVTKSVDFKRCKKIADIRFGPKIEKSCDKCNVEKFEERKLDRTTVIRQVFIGTPENFGLQKVEMVSHYMFKMINAEEQRPMRTIVAGELTYVEAQEARQSRKTETQNMGKEEKLIYSIEWDTEEKRFYMYGDEEFPTYSPFKVVSNKVNQIEKLISKLVNLWSDKVNGIESEATVTFTRIVELTRMCTVEELKQVYSKISRGSEKLSETEQIKAEDIFTDAMSQAGTRNTIQVLVEKILRNEIESTRAVRAITNLKGVPAPSEKQVEILLRLCNSEVAARSQPLKQTCWLTTGAIVGELCNKEITREDGFERNMPKPICHREQKQKFVKAIMDSFRKTDTRYEKILALKALGNAGLDESTMEIEKIIRDIREDPMVRMQAIDSLRRLRAQMPKRIQRILMPVFQNVRERPEIRMAAVSMILSTIPEKQMLDQIGYTLLKEPSRQVKSYVYTAMKHLSTSPVEMEKKLSKHLQALLNLADISEETEKELIRGSRFYRIPFYSQKNQEGLLAELESMVGPDNYLPKQLSARFDALFSGILEKNGMELRLNQENLENWYHKIYESMIEQYSYGSRKQSELRANRRSNQQGSGSSSEEDQERVNSMYSSLNIKKRNRDQFWKVDSDDTTGVEPYGMLSFRYADVDYAILPLEEEILPESVKRIIVSGEKPTMRDFEDLVKVFQGKHFRLQAAFHLLESSVKIPTSMGMPVRMIHLLPVLASVDGHIKAKLSGSEVTIDTNVHPLLTATHLKRVEVWCPIVMTGAETSQTVELNLPMNSILKIESESKKAATWTIKVPETKTQLFGFHSLPHTFVAEQDRTTQLPRMAMVKRIENQRLQYQQRSIDTTYGAQSLGLPLKISGDVHMPRDITSYKKIINTLLTSENHIHAVFVPKSESPKEIVLAIDGQAFIPHSESSTYHRQLKGFYGKAKFDDEYERHFEESDEQEDDESRLNSFLDNYEPRKMYKHQARIQLKTVGGSIERFGKLEVEAACDERVKYCNAKMALKRSPLHEEDREWEMNTKIQTLYPEYVSDIQELSSQNMKQKKFVAQIESEWGSDRKQSINVHINGEQFQPKQWIQKMSSLSRQGDYKSEEQMKLKIAFLNKFDISAEYKIQPWTQNMFNQYFTGLKAWEFWSTQVQPQHGRDGYVLATLVIDPITHEHVNMTVKTPSERVLIDSIRLPGKFKPFELVRQSGSSSSRANSFMDVVRSYSSSARPECKVDGRQIQTFDEVTVKAPLTKCYSVLAKDCSSQTPRFAVLMKKLSGEDKKIKVITGKQIIEVQPDNKGKLIVKINGDRVEDQQELLDYGIECNGNMIHIDTRDVTVRFNGQKAWIKLAQTHKNTQCGLCGHYNDDSEDVFRMANNENTQDMKEFHRSYSVMDDECREDFEETHRRERYERMNMDDEYQYQQDRQQDREQENKENQKPFEKTDVVEYNQKVCFSQKPVKECPRGTQASEEKEQKTKYICLQRSSSEARQLLREARRNPKAILELPEQNPSYTETMQIPVRCQGF